MNTQDRRERNKAIALRFKKSQGTPEMPEVEREVLSPRYDRVRGGGLHLAANAKDQGWPPSKSYLRSGFPDRFDTIEQVIAEDDRVCLLFRLGGTHDGSYCGIEPTGRPVDVYELAMLRIADDQMVEGWFMMDESELLKQLRSPLPPRNDKMLIVPEVPDAGEAPEVLFEKLERLDEKTPEVRNKLSVVRELAFGAGGQAPVIERPAFPNLPGGPASTDPAEQTLRSALDDHGLRIEAMVAEGPVVWARISFSGRQAQSLYGIPADGRRLGVHVVVIATFEDDSWARMWCLGDELGLLLQLGQPNLLVDVLN